MTVIINGTQGTTTPGLYSNAAFTGTYVDGIVADYNTGLGRISVGAADGLAFYNAGVATTELMRLDASGNLGLGVTPSAWGGPFKAIQSGNGGSAVGFQTNANVMRLFVNNFYNGTNYVYTGSAAASQYTCNSDGSFNWQIAASGTAGNAISFTQAMTLDASGNLGVGTTSPSTYNGQFVSYKATGSFAYFGHSNSGTFPKVSAIGLGSDAVGYTYTTSGSSVTVSGSVQIAAVQSASSSAPTSMVFITTEGGTPGERMRIDSNGSLLVGATSTTASEKLNVTTGAGATGGFGVYFKGTASNFTGQLLRVESANTSTNNSYNAIQFAAGGTERFKVQDSGNVNNTNNSYGGISDIKLKENIVDTTSKLGGLMQVRVVNYNLIGDTNKQLGVVAQELEQVFPLMVEEAPDRDAEGNDLGTTTKSVKYSVFVPMLIKAIQEQQAIIESLKARLDAANL